MKIELKNIKHLESMSEETNCFSADLWVDGIKTAFVGNSGHGGCDECRAYDGQDQRLAAAEAYCKTLPARKSEYFPEGLEQDLESVVGDILTDWLIARDLKKLLRKPAFFKDGDISTYSCKMDHPQLPALVQREEGKGATYLNALPFDKALEIFKGLAA